MTWLHILCFTVGGPLLVEVVGYIWHRYVEHKEMLGTGISHRHWQHHEIEYDIHHLRTEKYKDANSWTWYVLGAVTSCLGFSVLPVGYAVAIMAGGWLYAWGLVLQLHTAFHVEGHWLNRFKWFRNLVRAHDIHHYDNCNYGICFFFLDKLFGTYRADFPPERRNVFKTLKSSDA